MQGKIIGSVAAAFGVVAVIAVFAIPVMPSAPMRVSAPVATPVTTPAAVPENNVRGVIEMIDASSNRIRLAGKDYAFSPDKVLISDKKGKLPVSALKVGTKAQCVMVNEGANQYLTEVWVES